MLEFRYVVFRTDFWDDGKVRGYDNIKCGNIIAKQMTTSKETMDKVLLEISDLLRDISYDSNIIPEDHNINEHADIHWYSREYYELFGAYNMKGEYIYKTHFNPIHDKWGSDVSEIYGPHCECRVFFKSIRYWKFLCYVKTRET